MTKTMRTGWHPGPAYVLPDAVIGTPNEPLLYVGTEKTKLSEAGTLDGWKEHIAGMAVGNPLLILSLCAGFCGPLMGIAGQQTAGFHVKGESSKGKSTMLYAACSIYGKPLDYRRTWNSTEVGAENMLAAHNDLLLALDELHQCKPQDADRVVYMLGQNQGRNRGKDNGGLRSLLTWTCCVFSTGEVGLADHLRKANIEAQAGQQVRLIELRTERQHGAFDELHGLADGKALADHLKAGWEQHHGTAGAEFIRTLAEADHAQLREQFRQVMRAFAVEHVPAKSDGQVARVADYFALLAFAGELATSYGLTGWVQNTAYSAVAWAFSEWVRSRGTTGSLEDQKILRQVRRWFENNLHRFEELPIREHAGRTINQAGYVEIEPLNQAGCVADDKNGKVRLTTFFVYRNTWRDEVLSGLDPRKANALLLAHGILERGDGRNIAVQKQVRSESTNERYFKVLPAVWGGEDE